MSCSRVDSARPVCSSDSGSGGAIGCADGALIRTYSNRQNGIGVSCLWLAAVGPEGLDGLCRGRLRRAGGKPETGDTALAVGAVLEHQGAAVAFGDLAAEHQADARPARLRGEERDEQVGG